MSKDCKKCLNVKVDSVCLEGARKFCKEKGMKIDDLINEYFFKILFNDIMNSKKESCNEELEKLLLNCLEK